MQVTRLPGFVAWQWGQGLGLLPDIAACRYEMERTR